MLRNVFSEHIRTFDDTASTVVRSQELISIAYNTVVGLCYVLLTTIFLFTREGKERASRRVKINNENLLQHEWNQRCT